MFNFWTAIPPTTLFLKLFKCPNITTFEIGNACAKKAIFDSANDFKTVIYFQVLNFSFSTSSMPSPLFLLFLKLFPQFVNSDYMNNKYRVFSNILLLSQNILFHSLPQ